MKKTFTFIVALFLTAVVFAQTPMFFNTNAVGGANAFPLNNLGASRKVQWFIPANSLTGVTPGNNITRVWLQAGSTANQTYPTFTIKLKTGSGTGLTGVATGPVEPGMTVVYTAVNQVVSTTLGQWFGFNLQTPWLYDPTLPLIVEFEHDATTGTGPSVYQAFNIPGPGNGRQWANFNAATITGVGGNQVNFGIDVLPATPCTGSPLANSVTPTNFTTCPFVSNPTLSLATTYSFGGITYQWQQSTVSNIGPFTAIPGATMNTYPTPTIGITTWFNVVATCTNPGGGSTTLTANEFSVGGSVVNTVPYFEDFEGILLNNRLPNCSWFAQNLGTTVNSYVQANSGNRIARSGNKFGSFSLPSTNNTVYSNGITMQPGITYSAAIWYSTEYFGNANWTNLTLAAGPNQTTVGQFSIASVSPAISGPYKLLSGVFTVPSAGDYYICLRATGTSGSALYLNWDDLSVTIPCEGEGAVNSPTLSTAIGAGPFCEGDILANSASGADAYLWNNGDTNANTTIVASTNTIISVVGTNTLTGCSASAAVAILVNPAPVIYAFTSKPQACPGEVVHLNAIGANAYAWNIGVAASVATVVPSASTVYTVIGTAINGCSGTATVGVALKSNPTVIASNAKQIICMKEIAEITATGASTYVWYSSEGSTLYQGSTINVPLNASATFTVYGTGTNGCTSAVTISQNVTECSGIEQVSQDGQFISVFPNPSSGIFTLKLASGSIHKVVVTDMSGRVISEVTGNSTELSIDLSKLSCGVYFANVMDDNSTKTVRLVKE